MSCVWQLQNKRNYDDDDDILNICKKMADDDDTYMTRLMLLLAISVLGRRTTWILCQKRRQLLGAGTMLWTSPWIGSISPAERPQISSIPSNVNWAVWLYAEIDFGFTGFIADMQMCPRARLALSRWLFGRAAACCGMLLQHNATCRTVPCGAGSDVNAALVIIITSFRLVRTRRW